MTSKTKYRVIPIGMLITLDILLFFLSLGFYIVPKSLEHTALSGGMLGFIIILHFAIMMSKLARSPVFGALAYSMISYALVFKWLALPENLWTGMLPIAVFLLVLFAEFTTNLASGLIYGSWLFLISVIVRLPQQEGEYKLQYFFGPEGAASVIEEPIFIILIAIIVFVFSKPHGYDKITHSEKLLKVLLWLNLPFWIVFFQTKGEPNTLKFAAGYLVISWAVHRSLKQQSYGLAALAYGFIAFVLCYMLRLQFEVESFNFVILVPIVVALLVKITKMSAHSAVGLLCGYWLLLYGQLLMSGKDKPISMAELLTFPGLQYVVSSYVFLLICGLLLERKWIIGSLIKWLEGLNKQAPRTP
ncbi:hypothetical protein [Candidatus Pristimantibacillus sp. PTI5]|uniref:hypothetical protein n=1 Tax=Candidatus Pristimantibacillus sp. PTI5 TaxID=3400422 RepID=UPI003B01B888